MIQRAFRYRLYPTPKQAEALTQFIGATRFVYNLALEQRATFWKRGRWFNFATQGREVTQLRAEFDWIEAVPSGALTQALRDLDKAYEAFFSGRARYPSPRRKGVNDSFRCQAKEMDWRQMDGRWSALRVPKVGWVRVRDTRPIRGRCLNVTVSLVAGQWFASFACEIGHEAPPSTLPAVGIDRGIANTVALSTGELMSTPATDRLERQKKRAQRILARRKRGSARYRKQRLRVSRICAKIARVRADWRHRTTTDIANRFGTVVIEALQTKSMVRANRGLARSIHEQGWRRLEDTLAYKLEERGGTLIKVDPAYTSQTCSSCGTIDKASRKSQARFACRHCGFTEHADTNAAKVILRRSSVVVEGCGYAPDETRTNHALAA